MDRAPILEVDVPAGLDTTLLMLRSRMDSVEIERDYAPNLPRISAYGGELNQVWTALLENALDALGNRGRHGHRGPQQAFLGCRCGGSVFVRGLEQPEPPADRLPA